MSWLEFEQPVELIEMVFQPHKWGYCGENCTTSEEAIGPPDEPSEEDIEDYDGTILPNHKNEECGIALTGGGFIVGAGGTNAKKGSYPFIAAVGVKNTKDIGNLMVGQLDIMALR